MRHPAGWRRHPIFGVCVSEGTSWKLSSIHPPDVRAMPRMGIYSPVPQPLLAVSSGAQAGVPMPQRPCFPQRPWSSSEFKKIDNLAQSRRGAEMQNRFKKLAAWFFCSLCASASPREVPGMWIYHSS